MKVNKIFHWLYFLMLLLPIFAIPIYALYMTNKNATFSQEITVNQNKVVDFNQLIDGVEYLNIEDDVSGTGNVITALTPNDQYICVEGHTYLFKCDFENGTNQNIQGVRVRYPWVSNTYDTSIINISGVATEDNYFQIQVMKHNDNVASGESCNLKILQLFDLTQMFGSGNEPTITQFNQWYPNEYYNYTLSQKQLLKDYDQTTYTDTDVGSQFTYMLYNSVDKYFNYDNVFNFGTLYDYLQLNFFNGNAPIGFFIFWHYLIYFLLTSLLWLLFDVLMYVPNLIHRWIDKAEL